MAGFDKVNPAFFLALRRQARDFSRSVSAVADPMRRRSKYRDKIKNSQHPAISRVMEISQARACVARP
jgi:hypothetical protein